MGELLVVLLEHNNREIVFTMCGILMNMTADANFRNVLTPDDGLDSLIEVCFERETREWIVCVKNTARMRDDRMDGLYEEEKQNGIRKRQRQTGLEQMRRREQGRARTGCRMGAKRHTGRGQRQRGAR